MDKARTRCGSTRQQPLVAPRWTRRSQSGSAASFPPRRPAARAARTRASVHAARRGRHRAPAPGRSAHPRAGTGSARTSRSSSRYEMDDRQALSARDIFLDEASVMATENAIMAAALTPRRTVIGNAACEPHVQDLCRFLVSLGAEIDGDRVERPPHPRRGESSAAASGRIAPEHIEVGQLHRPGRGHEQQPHDRRRHVQGHGLDPHLVQAARDRGRARRRLTARSARTRSS